jgi:hypothetical protein
MVRTVVHCSKRCVYTILRQGPAKSINVTKMGGTWLHARILSQRPIAAATIMAKILHQVPEDRRSSCKNSFFDVEIMRSIKDCITA